MRVLSFCLLFSFILLSCKPGGSSDGSSSDTSLTETQKLEAQVMAVHDEVMPKMKDINTLSGALRKIKSGLVENEMGKIESPDGLDQVMESLKLAEQGMWDWMKMYGDTKATLKEDQLKSFYEKQLPLVEKIKQDMLSSIQKAEAWLAAHPSK